MPIYKGSTAIGAIYKGSTAISRVYKGDTLVFDANAGFSDLPERALVQKSAGQIVSTAAALIWGAETYDIGGWHDNVTNNTRLTTQAGVDLARIVTNCLSAASDNGAILQHLMNGASFTGKGHSRTCSGNVTSGHNITSAIIPIGTPGTDYFTTTLQAVSGNFTPSTEDYTWSFIENISSALPYVFARNSANQTTNNGTTTVLTFDTISGTQTGWHSGGNPTRITPTATLVRITGNIAENNVATNTALRVTKNGAAAYGLPSRQTDNSGGDLLNFASAPIVMNGTTDYLEVEVITSGASSILTGDASWVQVEQVPSTYQRALVYKTSNQHAGAGTSNRIYWDASAYDTASILQTKSSAVTITIASPGVVSWTGHGLADGDPVKLSTTGALPTGLTAGTVYYVRSSTANDFQLSLTTGGAAINTSGSQSGTHTATNKSRLLAPSGVTEARITFSTHLSSSTGGIDFSNTGGGGWVVKNRANFRGMPLHSATSAVGTRYFGAVSAWVSVSALSDFFEGVANPSGGISRNIVGDERTWLCVEFR